MKLRKYTEQQLREAVKNSTSLRQVLQLLNVKAAGGNYQSLNKACIFFEVDISHFSGRSWNNGRQGGYTNPITDYLISDRTVNTHRLRMRLINEGILEAECVNCKLKKWLGNSIPLELDHIDGNNRDNRIENLRLLCPNCHALTPTYRGKNVKS